MMLRSSSTPVLGSLLCSFSESPNHHHHHHLQSESITTAKQSPITTTNHNHNNKLSFSQTGSHNFTPFSFNSSPISRAVSEPQNSFRRAQSEGNLQGLVNSSSNNDEFNSSKPPKKFSKKPNCSVLQTIPSFSFHNSIRYEDEDSDEEEEREELEENGGFFNNPIRGKNGISRAMKGGEMNLEDKKMGFDGNIRFLNGFKRVGFEEKRVEVSSEMYLARGLGVDGVSVGFGGGGGGGCNGGCVGGGDRPDMEGHYKRMVEENPGNSLFLRNYAQYLYHSKQDLEGAEEYYSRAILANPKDGEILSQYAKLVWELHRDEDRATSYFERAVHAAPEDSHVHAAYATFLWETEEDEDEDNAIDEANVVNPFFHKEAIASATA